MMHGRDAESPAPDSDDTALDDTGPGDASPALEPVAVFCGNCSCGCPELFLDHGADDAHRVVLTDDFGQRVQMSLEQLTALVADVKRGTLDHLIG
jgi:hypothetical protein